MIEKTDLPALIAEVRRLDAAATKGPWTRGIGNEYRLVRRGLHETVAADCGADNGNLIAAYRTAAPLLADECERLRACCAKVNDIRNSIVGLQGFNFSEHAYPLVAALNAAGFEGLPYPEAKENVGTLLERATECSRLQERVRALEDSLGELGRQGHLECIVAPPCQACSRCDARAALEGIEVE